MGSITKNLMFTANCVRTAMFMAFLVAILATGGQLLGLHRIVTRLSERAGIRRLRAMRVM